MPSILPLQTRDQKPLLEFFSRFSPDTDAFFHPHPFNKAFVHKICGLPDRKYHVRLVAKDKQKIVGYTFLSLLPLVPSVGYFGIAVDDKYRGMGIGKALISHLFAVAQKRGVHEVHLNVLKKNTPAVHLYQKLGFQKIAVPFFMSKLFVISEHLYSGEAESLFKSTLKRVLQPMPKTASSPQPGASIWMKKTLL